MAATRSATNAFGKRDFSFFIFLSNFSIRNIYGDVRAERS
jgi:hypothetical protein